VSDTETYIEYGVFVWHGSAEVWYRTFRQERSIALWLELAPDEAAKISSIRTREVTIHRADWTEAPS
jgi:hypothetical protein